MGKNMSSAFKEKMRDEKMEAEEKGQGFFFLRSLVVRRRGEKSRGTREGIRVKDCFYLYVYACVFLK